MAEPRQSNRWDGTLNSVNFRIKRMEDGAGYRRDTQRSNLIFNQSEEHDAQFNSRNDIRTLYQTSWADGAFWNKPLLNAASINSYNTSEGMDVLTEPGSVLPLGTVTEQTGQEGNFSTWCSLAIDGDIYVVGKTDGGNLDWYQYDSSAGTWSALASDFATVSYPMGITYSPDQDQVLLYTFDGEINAMDLDGTSTSTIIDTGTPACEHGANIFFHFGRLFVYDGDILIEITDPFGTPGQTTIFDDGMGADVLDKCTVRTGSNGLMTPGYSRLAISTAEGIYIVKNVEHDGIPTATIHRVDRTNSGIDVGTPIATLPPGHVALDIAYSLGSVLVSTSSDYNQVFNNLAATSKMPGVTIFHLTNGSLGAVGSPLGYESPDESPYRFCNVGEDRLYLGGQKRLWAYDVVRGGLHPLIDTAQAGEPGRIVTFVTPTLDGSGNEVLRAFTDEGRYWDIERFTGTDNDSNTRQLDSNYFAFNIPAEQKTISHVTLMTDGVQSGETWTVSLDVDDGGFSSAATFTSSDDNTSKKRITPVTGYRFRYRLAYSASGAVASPSRVKGIVFHAIHGEMVTRWQLVIDGSEFTNVQNTVLRPDDVVSDWESIASQQGVVTFTDSFGLTSSSHNVKVEQVQITRSSPQEVDSVTCVLTEDT